MVICYLVGQGGVTSHPKHHETTIDNVTQEYLEFLANKVQECKQRCFSYSIIFEYISLHRFDEPDGRGTTFPDERRPKLFTTKVS